MITRFIGHVWLAVLFGAAFPLSAHAQNNSSPLNEEVPGTAEEVRPLGVGAQVPNVVVVDGAGASVPLRNLIMGKPSVLIFYRGGWCPYCNVQLGQLAKLQPELKDLGYQIVAISTDRPKKISEAQKRHKFPYLLYSDSKMRASRAFGLAFRVDDALVSTYKEKHGIDLEDSSGETHHMLPVPAAYVVSQEGEIHFAYSNPDYKVRVDPEELLAAARSVVKLK